MDNHQFKDVMDYWQQLQKMKQMQPLQEAQAKHANAQATREEALSKLPFAGHSLSGPAGEALGLEMIRTQYGDDSPQYKAAKYAFDLKQRRGEQTIEYQKFLQDTGPKRYATQAGKTEQEYREIQEGKVPGTTVGGQVGENLSDVDKQRLENQYGRDVLKKTTDADTRKRVLYAVNVDKTMRNINVDDLTSYSGIQGGMELLADKAADLKGNTTPRYLKYKKALENAALLKKQVRQFYGDSITKGVQADLEKITNPTSWLHSPKVAKEMYKSFKNTIDTERDTFFEGLNNPNIYKKNGGKTQSTPKYTDYQLQKFAQEARDKGVSEEKIAKKMAELKGEV